MGRSKYVIKNLIWEMGYYVAVVLFGFLAPRLIILAYGSEVNGLSATITQILNIVLLLQAGATTVCIFSLYKPIAQRNMEEVAIEFLKAEKFFKKISFLFLIIITLISLIVSFVIKSDIRQCFVFTAFMIMGAKSFFDLYFTSKFRIIFTAFQSKFIISIATLIEQIVYYSLVFVSIFFKFHFLFLYFWLFIGCIIKVLYLRYKFNKQLAPYLPKVNISADDNLKGRGFSLANEVSHSIVSSSTAIIISLLYGLNETSVYSVYALVSNALYLFPSAVYSSFCPSFGDLYASENDKYCANIFRIFEYIFIVFNLFLYFCMYFLIIPFIEIYTLGATDVNYVNHTLALLLTIQGILSAYRIPYNIIVSSCGFFKETWKQPVVCAILALAISFIFGLFDYSFVVLGPIFFYASNFVYQYWKLKKIVPKLVTNNIYRLLLITILGFYFTSIVTKTFAIQANVSSWIFSALLFGLGIGIFILILSFFFDRSDLLAMLDFIKKRAKKYV